MKSWKVLTKEPRETVGSRKVGSCKDGSHEVGMSGLGNLEPYISCPTCRILRQSEAAKTEDSKLEGADQGRKADSRKPQIWKLQKRLPQTQNVKPYEP